MVKSKYMVSRVSKKGEIIKGFKTKAAAEKWRKNEYKKKGTKKRYAIFGTYGFGIHTLRKTQKQMQSKKK